jgi:uncharacterized repeat protein (TIGR01451 family)
MRPRYLKSLGLLLSPLVAVAFSSPAGAAPARRVQFDLRGDFLIAGNTLGHDCATGVPAPLSGGLGNCGTFTLDDGGSGTSNDAIDVLWKRNADGSFTADTSVLPSQARSRSFVDLTNRTVRYARLYWSGVGYESCTPINGPTSCPAQVDTSVSFIAPDGVTRTVLADNQWTQGARYQASADVTTVVRNAGGGTYDVAGVDMFKPANLDSGDLYAGWSLIIVYEDPAQALRNVTLFDGFEFVYVNRVTGQPDQIVPATGTISGFQVPTGTGYDAKLGVVAYEGDNVLAGDYLKFNGITLSNAKNPSDNIFNGTRSRLGSSITNPSDRPQLTGDARSMGGIDFDIFDIKPTLAAGATQASFEAGTNGDFYFINAFVTSIATLAPNLEGVKTVKDLNGGTPLPGDELEYRIAVTNSGNDDAINSVLDDPLPAGVTYVPGSLLLDGVSLTDQAGDDKGEVTNGSVQHVIARPFTGLTAGVIQQGKTSVVSFRVRVKNNFSGALANQANVTAAGAQGDPSTVYPTDGLQSEPGNQTTNIFVEICDDTNAAACPNGTPLCNTTASPKQCAACLGDNDCTSPNAPLCNLSTHQCQACTTDAACAVKDPSKPACATSGACVICTTQNETACQGATPACNGATNTCVECTDNSDCTSPTGICDKGSNKCVQCLNANDCPGQSACNASTKTCVACITSNDCAGVTPICNASICGACKNDAECKTKDPQNPVCATTGSSAGACVPCTPGNASACPSDKPVCSANDTCVACTKDSECTGGLKCDTTSNTCVGCVGSADCGAEKPVCDTTTDTCVGCTSDGQCAAKDANTPVCLDNGTCVACDGDTVGACKGDKPLCDTTTNTCIGCETNDDCTQSGAMICDPTTKSCVECATSADCAGGTPICDAGTHTCTPCAADDACAAKDPALPICLQDKGSCVACTVDNEAACGEGKVCDGASNTCVECLQDDNCQDPTKPACNPGTKTCVECTETKPDACTGTKPTCDTGSNTCVGCSDDSECNGDTPICDLESHGCVACKADGECETKDPAKPVCSDAGTCVTCTPDSAAQCQDATPKCDPGSFQCVECVNDDDCTDPSKPECVEGTCKAGTGVAGSGGAGGDTGAAGDSGDAGDGGDGGDGDGEPVAGNGGQAGDGPVLGRDIVLAGGACSCSVPTQEDRSPAAFGLAAGFFALVMARRKRSKLRAFPRDGSAAEKSARPSRTDGSRSLRGPSFFRSARTSLGRSPWVGGASQRPDEGAGGQSNQMGDDAAKGFFPGWTGERSPEPLA